MKKIRTPLKLLSAAALIALTAALAACTMTNEKRPQPHYAYKDYPPTVLGVATIQVIQEYAMPSRDPNVEHLMPQPLPFAVADWARTRFKAGGTDGNLIVTIKDASLIGQDLPKTKGVEGWFTIDQSQRYDGRITVEFRIDGTAGSSGSGSVQVNRGQTVPENTSIQGRDKAWTSMEEQMLTDLDANTQKMLQNRLPFLIK